MQENNSREREALGYHTGRPPKCSPDMNDARPPLWAVRHFGLDAEKRRQQNLPTSCRAQPSSCNGTDLSQRFFRTGEQSIASQFVDRAPH